MPWGKGLEDMQRLGTGSHWTLGRLPVRGTVCVRLERRLSRQAAQWGGKAQRDQDILGPLRVGFPWGPGAAMKGFAQVAEREMPWERLWVTAFPSHKQRPHPTCSKELAGGRGPR